MAERFWIVANLGSAHWLMRDARIFYRKSAAIDYAKELAGRLPHEYHVFEAIASVERASMPVRVTDLQPKSDK